MNDSLDSIHPAPPFRSASRVFGVALIALGIGAIAFSWTAALAIDLLIGVTTACGIAQGAVAFQAWRAIDLATGG